MLSMHQNERYLYESLKAGASGYVLKSVVDRDLLKRAAPPCAARNTSTRAR